MSEEQNFRNMKQLHRDSWGRSEMSPGLSRAGEEELKKILWRNEAPLLL